MTTGGAILIGSSVVAFAIIFPQILRLVLVASAALLVRVVALGIVIALVAGVVYFAVEIVENWSKWHVLYWLLGVFAYFAFLGLAALQGIDARRKQELIEASWQKTVAKVAEERSDRLAQARPESPVVKEID
jgi:MFS family permease